MHKRLPGNGKYETLVTASIGFLSPLIGFDMLYSGSYKIYNALMGNTYSLQGCLLFGLPLVSERGGYNSIHVEPKEKRQ